MRVAFFTSHINRSLQWLWYHEELKNQGIKQIHVVINDFKPALYDDLKNAGVEVVYLKHKGLFSHLKNLYLSYKILKKFNPDVVHTTLPYGNLIGLISAKLAGVPLKISTCENASWAHDFKNKKQERIDRLTFKLADYVIAVADSAFEYLSENWKFDKSKLKVIYHGIKESDYQNVDSERINILKKQLQIKKGDFIIGMISRLEFWKGHKYAISAMKSVVEKYPNAKLLIFGSGGPEYDNINKQIADNHLINNVKYYGFVNDSIGLFQLFDVHLHVPINKYVENCGISIIEGMMASRPQVLTKSGYAAQSAIDHQNALVAEYQDAESISKALIEMIENPDLRSKLGKQAHLDAIKDYSLKTKLDKHLSLYKSYEAITN